MSIRTSIVEVIRYYIVLLFLIASSSVLISSLTTIPVEDYVSFIVVISSSIVLLYISREEDLSHVVLQKPNKRDVKYIILGGALCSIISLVLVFLSTGSIVTEYGQLLELRRLILLFSGSVLLVPIVEEVFYRGYMQKRLMDGFDKWDSILFTAFLFAMAHFSSSLSPVSYVTIFINSVIYSYCYEETDNILVPILIHSLYNLVVLLPAVINILR